jgi:hypothetical protein
MTKFIHALTALEYLLDKAGENRWRDWLRQDIDLWESKKGVSHHLSAYGAMGSINDVWICVQNKHNVTKAQEPWVNNLFEILKGLCFRLAHNPEIDENIKDVDSNRYFPIFSAFKNNFKENEMDDATSQLSIITSQLHGWRCLKCGHAETSSYNIENYLAKALMPNLLNHAKNEKELKALVDSAFTIEFEGVDEARNQTRRMILDSEIKIIDREGWMRPCPKCGSDDTAVYRWELSKNNFNASKDNLPLKKATA